MRNLALLILVIIFPGLVYAQAPQCTSFSTEDKDFDGILAANDCDDNDFGIVTGTPRFFNGQYQRCDEEGNWITVTGKQHWVDCDAAVNGNGDSPATPFNTACCLDQYNSTTGAATCPGQTNLAGTHQPGDIIWVKGQCDADCPYAPGAGETASLFLRSEFGAAGNPIEILGDPTGTQNFDDRLYLRGSEFIRVQGINRSNEMLSSIDVSGGSNIEILNNTFERNYTPTQSTAGNNPADIRVTGTDTSLVQWNVSIDPYPFAAVPISARENISNFVAFNAGDLTVNRNYFTLPTLAASGCGNQGCSALKIKHSDHASQAIDAGGTEIAYNFIEDVVSGIDFSQQNTDVHHNYIRGATEVGLLWRDAGGPAFTKNIDVYNNTVETAATCWDWQMHRVDDSAGGDTITGGEYGPFSFTNNVCKTNTTTDQIASFATTGQDIFFDEYLANWASLATVDNNCYESTNDPFPNFGFDEQCEFPDWQGTSNTGCPLAWDVNSVISSANLDACGCTTSSTTNPQCYALGAGYCLSETTTAIISLFVGDTSAGENNGGAVDNGQFNLSIGPALPFSTTVQIAITGTASNGVDYVTIPTTIVIPPNTSIVPIDLTVLEDTLDEGAGETVVLTLLSGTVPDPTYSIVLNSNATTGLITIADDDVPGVTTTTTTLPGTMNMPLDAECTNPDPDWLWCDDFEGSGTLASNYYSINNPDKLSVATTDPCDGTNSLRFDLQAGEVSGSSIVQTFGNTPAGITSKGGQNQDYDDIYWRYYFKYSPTYQYSGASEKNSRAFVFGLDNVWAQAAISHVWTAPVGNVLAVDPVSGTDPVATLATTSWNDFANFDWLGLDAGQTVLQADQWYCVESRMKLNTLGNSDGISSLWINGVLEAESTDLNFRDSWDEYGINAVMLSHYVNAGTPTSHAKFVDDLVISTSPIGCRPATPAICEKTKTIVEPPETAGTWWLWKEACNLLWDDCGE